MAIPESLLLQSADALLDVIADIKGRELEFLMPSKLLAEKSRQAARLSFNLSAAIGAVKGPLQQLHTKGFEPEGLWEQLRMHGKSTIGSLEEAVDAAEARQDEASDDSSGSSSSDASESEEDSDEESSDEEAGAEGEDDEALARIRRRAMAFEDGDSDDDEDDDDDDEEEEEGTARGKGAKPRGGLDPDMYTWTGHVRESALPVDEDAAGTEDKVFKWNDMDRFLEDMEEAQERGMAEHEQGGEGAEDKRLGPGAAEEEEEEEESESDSDGEVDADFYSAQPTAMLEAHERVKGGGSLVSKRGAAAAKRGAKEEAALSSIAGYLAAQKAAASSTSSSASSSSAAAGSAAGGMVLGRQPGESKEQALQRLREAAALDDDFFGPRDGRDGSSAGGGRGRWSADDRMPKGFGEEDDEPNMDGLEEEVDDDEDDDEPNMDGLEEDEDEDEDEYGGRQRKRVRFGSDQERLFRADDAPDATADDDDLDMDGGEDDAADDDAEAAKTSYERQQAALRAQIAMLEKDALSGYLHKHWLMRGEVDSGARPENSLLEAALEHETAIRPPPPLTAQATVALEDMIRRRIADGLFDDPQARERQRPDLGETEKQEELATEKAARGLGDEYEDQFKAQVLGHKGESRVAALEREVTAAWAALSGRLDSLSHMTFTPRMTEDDSAMAAAEAGEDAAEERAGVRVRESAPALAMEDVQPTMGAAAAALAMDGTAAATPQEVQAAARGRAGVVVGDSEMGPDEKQRRRRAAKARRRKTRRDADAAVRAAERLNPGLGNKHEVNRLARELGSQRHVQEGKDSGRAMADFATSSKFFARMQDEARTEAAKLARGGLADEPERLVAVSKRSRKSKHSKGGAAASVML